MTNNEDYQNSILLDTVEFNSYHFNHLESLLTKLDDKIAFSRKYNFHRSTVQYEKLKQKVEEFKDSLSSNEYPSPEGYSSSYFFLKDNFDEVHSSLLKLYSEIDPEFHCSCFICQKEAVFNKKNDNKDNIVDNSPKSELEEYSTVFEVEKLRHKKLSELVELVEKYSNSFIEDSVTTKRRRDGFTGLFKKETVVTIERTLTPAAKSIMDFRNSLPPKIDSLITHYKIAVDMGASPLVLEEAERVFERAIIDDDERKARLKNARQEQLDNQFLDYLKEATRKNVLDIEE